jgi:hypothetical protein
MERTAMAIRLARWLADQNLRQADRKRIPEVAQDRLHVVASLRDADAGLGETGPRGVTTSSLLAIAQGYAGDSGFVDWARRVLRGGEPNKDLAAALVRLVDRVTELREAENLRFGQALADQHAMSDAASGLVTVEQMLDQVVRVCQAIKQVLAGSDSRDWWSQRAQARREEIRAEFSWLDVDNTVVLAGPGGEIQWWTFGGAGANASLSQALSEIIGGRVSSDSLALSFGTSVTMDAVESALQQLRQRDSGQMRPRVEGEAVDGLKFPRAAVLSARREAVVDTSHQIS